jgi:hypothetical protein
MKVVRGRSIFTPVASMSCIMALISEAKAIGSSFFNSRLKRINQSARGKRDIQEGVSAHWGKENAKRDNGVNLALIPLSCQIFVEFITPHILFALT